MPAQPTWISHWEQIEETVRRVTGRPATQVSLVSPGKDVWLIYIGTQLSYRGIEGNKQTQDQTDHSQLVRKGPAVSPR